MGTEVILAIIAGLVAIIPLIIKMMNSRKANRNDIGKVESAELLEGMDRVDAVPPPAGVQSDQQQN